MLTFGIEPISTDVCPPSSDLLLLFHRRHKNGLGWPTGILWLCSRVDAGIREIQVQLFFNCLNALWDEAGRHPQFTQTFFPYAILGAQGLTFFRCHIAKHVYRPTHGLETHRDVFGTTFVKPELYKPEKRLLSFKNASLLSYQNDTWMCSLIFFFFPSLNHVIQILFLCLHKSNGKLWYFIFWQDAVTKCSWEAQLWL